MRSRAELFEQIRGGRRSGQLSIRGGVMVNTPVGALVSLAPAAASRGLVMDRVTDPGIPRARPSRTNAMLIAVERQLVNS